MSVTEKKLKANRLNTNKSSGPKTERGKQIVNQKRCRENSGEQEQGNP